jgi:hypothetical protein
MRSGLPKVGFMTLNILLVDDNWTFLVAMLQFLNRLQGAQVVRS